MFTDGASLSKREKYHSSSRISSNLFEFDADIAKLRPTMLYVPGIRSPVGFQVKTFEWDIRGNPDSQFFKIHV